MIFTLKIFFLIFILLRRNYHIHIVENQQDFLVIFIQKIDLQKIIRVNFMIIRLIKYIFYVKKSHLLTFHINFYIQIKDHIHARTCFKQ